MNTRTYKSLCEEDTLTFGSVIAGLLVPGDVVAMYGDLGTGKTEFIRGVCSALQVTDLISSPTFTIVNEYTGLLHNGVEVSIQHIDLYRLESADALEEIGLTDILGDPSTIKLVEWSEHSAGMIPEYRYEVRMTSAEDDENCRTIEVTFPDGITGPEFVEDGETDQSAGIV